MNKTARKNVYKSKQNTLTQLVHYSKLKEQKDAIEKEAAKMQTNIAAIRRSKNMSQEELAAKAGVSRVIISQLENNKRAVITTETMFKISKALEMPIESIFVV